jgi:hypothetical protein
MDSPSGRPFGSTWHHIEGVRFPRHPDTSDFSVCFAASLTIARLGVMDGLDYATDLALPVPTFTAESIKQTIRDRTGTEKPNQHRVFMLP